MITKFSLLDLSKPYFWVSDNALVEVRFSKATIGTHDGEITYYATLPSGEKRTIASKIDDPIKVYASPEDYLQKRHIAIPSVSLESIARQLALPIRYKELDGEKVAFHFVVWTIDKGIAKEVRLYAGVITVSENNTYTINDDFPEKYYTDRDTMERLHPTKVIAEDGTESVVGGELSPLFLSDEQRAILNEWLEVTKRLEQANVTIISSESTGNFLAVNNAEIDRIYGYEESYKGIIPFDSEKAPEFHIPKVPFIVCNDYDSGDMWFMMKQKELAE